MSVLCSVVGVSSECVVFCGRCVKCVVLCGRCVK